MKPRGGSLEENVRALGIVPYKREGRKWFLVHGMEVSDWRDWVAAAESVGTWCGRVEKPAEEFEEAWQCEDLRSSDPRHKQETVGLRAANGRAATAGAMKGTRSCKESKIALAESVPCFVSYWGGGGGGGSRGITEIDAFLSCSMSCRLVYLAQNCCLCSSHVFCLVLFLRLRLQSLPSAVISFCLLVLSCVFFFSLHFVLSSFCFQFLFIFTLHP